MIDILFFLIRATLLLSAAFCFASVLLRITRCQSWFVHRTVWFSVLLLGVLAFVPWSKTLEIPVLQSNNGQNQSQSRNRTIAEIATPTTQVQESKTLTNEPAEPEVLTTDFVELPLPFVELSNEIAPTEISYVEIEPTEISGGSIPNDKTYKNPDIWKILIIAVWVAGILFISLRQLIRFTRVRYLLRDTSEPCCDWSAEWEQLQSENGIAKLIPMRIAENIGPALIVGQSVKPSSAHRSVCRLVLIVPLEGWDNLSTQERRSVMLHELAHYRRGDIWTSLLARILALPHWFNPLANLTVRRYEEAAEWACDEAALGDRGESAAVFAKALVSLQESASVRPVLNEQVFNGMIFQHNIFGQNISRRVVRLMTFNTLNDKESMMKKAFLLCVCVLLIGSAFVQIRLTAQQPNNKEKEAAVTATTDKNTPVPAEQAATEVSVTEVSVPATEWDKNTWSRTRVLAAREKIEKQLSEPLDFGLTKVSTYSDLFTILKEQAHIVIFWDNRFINDGKTDVQTISSVIANVEPARYGMMPLGRALELILQANNLAYVVDEGFLLITSENRAADLKIQQSQKSQTVTPASPFKQLTAPQAAPITAPPVAPADPDYVKLLQQRIDTAQFKLADTEAKVKAGTGSRTDYEEAKLALAEAVYALKKFQQSPTTPASTDPDYVKLLQQRIDTAQFKLADTEAKVKAGTGSRTDYEEAMLACSEAAYALARYQKFQTTTPAPADPDYVKLLQQRIDTAQFKVADEEAKANAGTGSRTDYEEALLACSEAIYAFIQSQQSPTTTPAPADPDYVKLLQQRIETAQFKVADMEAKVKAGTGSRTDYEEAKLALAEAVYALKKFQQSPTTTPANPFKQLTEPQTAPTKRIILLNEKEDGLSGNKTPTAPTDPAQRLQFQGQNFDYWVRQLYSDLDPNIRAEAFRALGMFGANGMGKQVAEVIFDATQTCDFTSSDFMYASRDGDNPVAKMKKAAVVALSNWNGIPSQDALSIILNKLTHGTPSEQSLASIALNSVAHLPIQNRDAVIQQLYDTFFQWDWKDDVCLEKYNRPQKLVFLIGGCFGRSFRSGITSRLDSPNDKNYTAWMLKLISKIIADNDVKRFQIVFGSFESGGIHLDKQEKTWMFSDTNAPFALLPFVAYGNLGGRNFVDGNTERGLTEYKLYGLTDYGESLLKLLKGSGVMSKDETIRETSKKIVAALESVEKSAEVPASMDDQSHKDGIAVTPPALQIQ